MFVVAHNGSAILGGGETGTAILLAGLQARGHRVLMLCRDREIAGRIGRYGIPTDVQRVGGGLMLPDSLRLAVRLRRLAPDALILTTFKKSFLAGLGARLARVPFVVQRVVLSTDVPRRASYRLAVRRFVDLVTLNAAEIRPGFLAADPGLDPARVVTVLDGVKPPLRRAEPGALRRELSIPAEARVVGAVGRLARQKRYDRLLRAMTSLPSDVHCLIAGEGDERAALERLADASGLGGRVHLVGFRDDVGDVLDALDLFVICSDREGMANAMLEAMASGLPVVSTPVSGAAEALGAASDEPGAGVLVDDFSDAALREALRRVLDDDALRAELGRVARSRWERYFGWDRFIEDWETLLERGVAAGHGVR